MDGDMQWLIGVSTSVVLACVTTGAGAFWRVINMIRRTEEQFKREIESVHSRVTRVREETVHKSDLVELANRLSADMREMREDQRKATSAMNGRLDALLSAIAHRNTDGGSGQ